MKKLVFTLGVVVIAMTSCSDNGKKAETKSAKEVTVSKNEATIIYNKISENSSVDWRATHFAGAQPRFGKIQAKETTVLVNSNVVSNAKVVMDMSSFTVDSFTDDAEKAAQLTGHLQSADFFDIKTYPTSTFELTNLETTSGDFNSKVTGNLTIMSITKSITFSANIDVKENSVSIKSEDFSVDRRDWNLVYHTEGTAGVPANYIIADDIGFTINVEVSK